MNDYDSLSEEYNKAHEKPDLKYSIAPTFLKIAEPLKGKMVIDIVCGDGFFANQLAKKAKQVIGIDNSQEQITKAKKHQATNVKYFLTDMLQYDYPKSDIISAPFVLNYFKTSSELASFLKKLYSSLNNNSKIISTVDTPSSKLHDFKKYGSIKKIPAGLVEGAEMTIELYNKESLLVTLHSFHHTKENIEKSLISAGLKNISWHKPIISQEGIQKFGKDFWSGYLADCDLSYFSAIKSI